MPPVWSKINSHPLSLSLSRSLTVWQWKVNFLSLPNHSQRTDEAQQKLKPSHHKPTRHVLICLLIWKKIQVMDALNLSSEQWRRQARRAESFQSLCTKRNWDDKADAPWFPPLLLNYQLAIDNFEDPSTFLPDRPARKQIQYLILPVSNIYANLPTLWWKLQASS